MPHADVQSGQARVACRATFHDYVETARPEQWIKNVIVLAGPAAGLKLLSASAFGQVLLTFAAFCLAASAGYAINDVVDRRADISHPTKCRRPVAAGRLSSGGAIAFGLALAAVAAFFAVTFLPRGVFVVLAVYFVVTVVYSITLKRRVILDVIVIAIGFVLRALAGSLTLGVPTSEWLIACVFTLCLFMGFGKRRCEIAMLGQGANLHEHRRTLVRYTPDLLNHLLTVSAGIAVITFLLYTLDSSGTPPPFKKQQLFFTLPLVVYGIFRFAMLTELGRYTGPTDIVLKDRAMLITVILWTACALTVAYQNVLLGPAGLDGLLGGAINLRGGGS
ncbi:MAG: decaprenyl-phosphate phosphoribosyltransferase [Planctomycetota bacterium]